MLYQALGRNSVRTAHSQVSHLNRRRSAKAERGILSWLQLGFLAHPPGFLSSLTNLMASLTLAELIFCFQKRSHLTLRHKMEAGAVFGGQVAEFVSVAPRAWWEMATCHLIKSLQVKAMMFCKILSGEICMILKNVLCQERQHLRYIISSIVNPLVFNG